MRAPAWLAVVALAACGNIASPAVTDVYSFTTIDGSDTLTFHWAREQLPVRIWVAGDSPIHDDVVTAIARWQGAFLYGEFRGALVADSATADIIIRNAPSDQGGGLAAHSPDALAPQCVGETDLDLDSQAHTLRLPIHVFVYAIVSDVVPGIATCFSITTTHELGHAIGMLEHSPNAGDVMFANPVFDGISDRDRQTAVALYHVPATITITGRR